jgi:pyruvate dehydrogenase (quinone)/pyruvate oxidase
MALPGGQVVAFAGDGSFTMMMGDFATLVAYGLPVKVVVIKNNTLGLIKWEQMLYLGNSEYGVDLHPVHVFREIDYDGDAAGLTVAGTARCIRRKSCAWRSMPRTPRIGSPKANRPRSPAPPRSPWPSRRGSPLRCCLGEFSCARGRPGICDEQDLRAASGPA